MQIEFNFHNFSAHIYIFTALSTRFIDVQGLDAPSRLFFIYVLILYNKWKPLRFASNTPKIFEFLSSFFLAELLCGHWYRKLVSLEVSSKS